MRRDHYSSMPLAAAGGGASGIRWAWQWLLTTGKFFAGQAALQLVGFATGILVIRSMPPQEYAYYTIAYSTQGTLNLLADMGISTAMLTMGGRVWPDPRRFGQVVQTALKLRYWLATRGTLVMVPVMLYLLVSQGSSIQYAVLLSGCVLVGFPSLLSIGVLGIVPRLHAQLTRLQLLDFGSALGRLLLVCSLYLTGMNTSALLLGTSMIVAVQCWVMRTQASEMVDMTASPTDEYRAEMLRSIRSQALYVIYYCFQNQITFWLISFLGKTESIAQAGALGRLAMLFTVVSSVVGNVLVPRFARCQDGAILRRRYAQIVGTCVLLALALVAAAFFLTPQLLWLLGGAYEHLRSELHITILNSVVVFISASILSLNNARGWTSLSWVHVPATLVTQTALLYFININTLHGVLIIGLFSQLPSLLLNLIISWHGFEINEKPAGK